MYVPNPWDPRAVLGHGEPVRGQIGDLIFANMLQKFDGVDVVFPVPTAIAQHLHASSDRSLLKARPCRLLNLYYNSLPRRGLAHHRRRRVDLIRIPPTSALSLFLQTRQS